jgi:hypothetical protein
LSAEARLRAKADATKQSMLRHKERWIASRSLSSGAHSRDPLARNDVDRVSIQISNSSAKFGQRGFNLLIAGR